MNDAMPALAPALATALVQFVWQGALLGALAWLALVLLRDARPQARYAVACLALLSCVVLPLGSVLQALSADVASTAGFAGQPLKIAAVAAMDPANGVHLGALPDVATPWIVAAWIAGVFLLSLRMACGLAWVGLLRRHAARDPGGEWQRRVDRLAARLDIGRRVALRLMREGDTPLTAGWWRPVVLLPIAVAARMPVELVEALLAHELAHVRRHDYLVNVLQGVVEALLFYHPVVWWLSHRVRVERELVADDLAAEALGDRRRLALALSELDRFAARQHESFLPDFAPAAHGGQLMPRIQQLIRPQRRSAGALFALPMIGLALAGAAFYAQARLAAPQAATLSVPAPAPAPAAHPAPRALPAPAAAPGARVLPAPAAAPGPRVLPEPATRERSSYALVRDGEDGIQMSGNADDSDDIEAARARIDGDFLWFRRDGKAWVVRDAATVARARQAWAGTEAIEKEMHALEAKMKPHEAKLQALAAREQAMAHENPMDSPAAHATMKNVEALSEQARVLAERQAALALRMRRAGEADREDLDRDLQRLDRQQESLNAELERHSAKLQAMSARMAEQAAPRQALARAMEAASQPMQQIGAQMQGVGQRIEREARIADRQVRSLIDQAYRDGRAEPAPVRR